MGWARLDDRWHDHPKTIAAGLEASGLFVMCLTWAHQARRTSPSPGVIPDAVLGRLAGGKAKKLTKVLHDVGFLDNRTPAGWPIHDFDEYLPKYDPEQAKAAGSRGGRARAAKQTASEPLSEPLENLEAVGVAESEQTSSTRASARRNPVPVPKELSSEADERADVEALCTRLADRIEGNGANRPEVTQKWRDECRRMIDLDKRDPERAARLIDWCQADPFWRSNVLSMPTFRTKYDQLRLKATSEWEARKGGLSPDGDMDPETVLGPDSWTIPDPPDGVEPGTAAYRDWARGVRDAHKAQRLAEANERLGRRAS